MRDEPPQRRLVLVNPRTTTPERLVQHLRKLKEQCYARDQCHKKAKNQPERRR